MGPIAWLALSNFLPDGDSYDLYDENILYKETTKSSSMQICTDVT